MKHFLFAAALLMTGPALADVPVGEWSNGQTALSVTADGTFDWTTPHRATEGKWTASEALVSLASSIGSITYAYTVVDDRLTLMDAAGGTLVFDRPEKRSRR